MNKNVQKAQGGFSLIELIIVVVIMGVLAATALPKFAGVGADARFSNLQSAKGALESLSTAVHGKAIMSASNNSYTMEDGTTIAIKNGYMDVTSAANIKTALGLTDWAAVPISNDGTDTFTPVTSADEIAFVPPSVKGTTTGATCFVKYKQAATAGAQAVITMAADSSACK
jgi:MSHA pilin protein MshA